MFGRFDSHDTNNFIQAMVSTVSRPQRDSSLKSFLVSFVGLFIRVVPYPLTHSQEPLFVSGAVDERVEGQENRTSDLECRCL